MTRLEVLRLAITTAMENKEREARRLEQNPLSQIAKHHYENAIKQIDFLHAEILKLEAI